MPGSGSSTPRSSARRMCGGSRSWGSSPRCSHHTPATTCAGPMLGSARGASTVPMPGAGSRSRRSRWRSAAISPSRSSTPSGASMRQSLDRMPREPPGGWHPEQRLSLEEALRRFTAGAAYAAFAEDRLGIHRVGMQADLTLVDRDLFRASPQDLLKSRIVMTIIAGQVAFESPGS